MSDRISHYRILREIGRGARGVVYLAEREGRKFALKTPLRDSPDELDTLVRFRRESFALSRLSHASIVKLVEASEEGGWPFLVMEYLDAENLKSRLRKGPLPAALALSIARQLAEALIEIHRLKMVHLDVKPENIIFTADDKVALIDFGMVSDVGLVATAPDGDVAGTIEYASPEQAGLSSGTVDETSDLYALGVLLFEMLTGKTPFAGLDENARLRMKRSETVENVHARDATLSPVLGEIVSKLTNPLAARRYRSARGLLADLNRLEELEAIFARGQSLPLGHEDRSLLLREGTLEGRAAELEALLRIWRAGQKSSGAVALIEGIAGMGKSRLVLEAARAISSGGGTALISRCSAADSGGLSTILDLIKNYMRQILRAPDAERAAILTGFRQQSESVRDILAGLSADLARELNVDTGRERVTLSREAYVQTLIQIFAQIGRVGGGLLIVVEDAQWIDEFSLEFMSALARDLQNLPVSLAVTIAPNGEVPPSLMRVFSQAPAASRARLRLEPLAPIDAAAMIASLVGAEVDEKSAGLIASPVGNVPQGIREHLEALVNAGVVGLREGNLTCDESRLGGSALALDAKQLIAMRLLQLGAADLRLLKYAAALGARVDVQQLSQVADLTADHVLRSLRIAEGHGLIEGKSEDTLIFTSERLREHLVAELATEEANRVRRLGISYYETLVNLSAEDVQTLAGLYLQVGDAESSPEMFRAMARAGRQSLDTYSDKPAYRVLHFAYARLPEGQLAPAAEECLELYGIACLNTARFADAEKALDRAMELKADPLDQASILYWKMRVKLGEGKTDDAWSVVLRALRLAGNPYPTNKWVNISSLLLFAVCLVFQVYTGIGFGRLQGAGERRARERRRRRQVAALLEPAGSIAFVRFKAVDSLHITIRAAVYAHGLGKVPELAMSLATASVTLSALGLTKIVDRMLGSSFNYAAVIGDGVVTSRVWFYYLVSRVFMGRLDQLDEALPRVLPDCERLLPRWQGNMLLTAIQATMSSRGQFRQLVEFQGKRIGIIDDSRDTAIMSDFRITYAYRLRFLGRMEEAQAVREEANLYYQQIRSANPASRSVRSAIEAFAAAEWKDVTQVDPEQEADWEAWLVREERNFFMASVYALIAMARVLQYEFAPDPELKARRLADIHRVLKVCRKCLRTPMYDCLTLSVRATAERAAKNYGAAEKLIQRAEEMSVLARSEQGFYFAYVERVRLARDRGQMARAKAEARAAYTYAEERGWVARQNRLRQEFPDLLPAKDTKAEAPDKTGGLGMERAMNALLEISAAASKHIDPIAQGRSTLDTVTRLLGAERACIFVGRTSADLNFFLGRTAKAEDIIEMKGFSTTVVRKVFEERQPVIITGTDQGEAIGSKSIVAHNLKSIMVVPLVLQDEVMGVIYLDSSLTKGLFSDADLSLFVAISTQIAASIHISSLAVLESERQVMKKDLELSASVQKMFLPSETAWHSARFHVAGFYRPAAQCGGDWWWYGMRDGRLSVLVGDVTGHGAGPAMITASVASGFKIMRQDHALDMRELICGSHELLLSIAHTEYAMTMFGCEIDEPTRRIRFWSACAPQAILMDKAGGNIRYLDAKGGLVGLEDFFLENGEVQANPGDRLFIYSDGISEMFLPDGRQFGERRLGKLLAKHRGAGVEAAKDLIVQELDQLRGAAEQDDDFTFVMIDLE